MPNDCDQKEVTLGQEVWIKARITGISEGAACNCNLQIIEPDGNKTQEHCPTIYLNSSLVRGSLPTEPCTCCDDDSDDVDNDDNLPDPDE